MNYFIDLFTDDTFNKFLKSNRTISGFKPRQEYLAKRVSIGDRFLCYMVGKSCWVAILEVMSDYFFDSTPIFIEQDDPYTLRFNVKPIVILDPKYYIPFRNPLVWDALSFTKGLPINSSIVFYKNSLNKFPGGDGEALQEIIFRQVENKTEYPQKKLKPSKSITATLKPNTYKTQKPKPKVIKEGNGTEANLDSGSLRESYQIQSILVNIGIAMGYSIWLPRNDRGHVMERVHGNKSHIPDRLPLNYDQQVLSSIENIDVIWIKDNAIIRAFEVEHTTAIYSGILRMADLRATIPNLNINIHIVAPDERRQKVLDEIKRPAFRLSSLRLPDYCSFLSYSKVYDFYNKYKDDLRDIRDSIIDRFCEKAI